MKALEVGEFEILLREIQRGPKQATARRDTLAILLMHDVGLRVGETCAIEPRDLTRDHQWLTVRGAIAKHRRDHPGDDQIVAVSPRTRNAYAEWMQERGTRKAGPLLLTTAGKPVHPHHYNLLLARIGERHLGRHVHPHMLRHSCGTVLVADHGKLVTARDQLRHRSIATTNRYVSARPKQAMADVEQAFG